MTVDVVERIDELIAGEKCPHCERDFHQGVLTQKVAAMFESGNLDRNYFAHEDISPIVCDGSTFIGPLRPEPTKIINDWTSFATSTFKIKLWTDNWDLMSAKTGTFITSWGDYTQKWILGADQSAPWIFPQWTISSSVPEPVCTEPAPEIDVEFGPQNWHYEFQRPPQKTMATHWSWSPTPKLAKQVTDLWKKFNAVPTPTPRGYDFSAFTGELTNTGPDKGSITKGRKK